MWGMAFSTFPTFISYISYIIYISYIPNPYLCGKFRDIHEL